MFLQYCILFPLWLFSQPSVAYVFKAEVLSLLVDLLPQLLHIFKKKKKNRQQDTKSYFHSSASKYAKDLALYIVFKRIALIAYLVISIFVNLIFLSIKDNLEWRLDAFHLALLTKQKFSLLFHI